MSKAEVVGDDQRRNASDRPSGEKAGDPSPMTPCGGESKVLVLPSDNFIK
jgi:hypothetical protein